MMVDNVKQWKLIGKVVLIIALTMVFIVLVIAIIGFFKFNFTSDDVYIKDKEGNLLQIDDYERKIKNKELNDSIPYEMANGYFVKNTFKKEQLTNPLISTQEGFDNVFGVAGRMGEEGKPTSIDFSKQFVIVILEEMTDKKTTLTLNSLEGSGDEIRLKYSIKQDEKQSFTIQPVLVLIIDNKYKNEKVKIERTH